MQQWRWLFPDLANALFSTAPAKPAAQLTPVRFIRTFGAFGLEEDGEVKP